MKVLLAHKFFNYNGGADVFFFEVGRVLKENGHEVAYFSTKSEKNEPSEWSRYFVDAPDFKSSNPLTKLKALASIPYNRGTKKAFEKLLDDFQPDVIHCFNIMTQISPSILVAAKERNIPVVISLNDYKHICPNYKLFHHGRICEDCKNGGYIHCFKNKCAHDSAAFSLASTIESYVHKWMDVYLKNISLFLFASDFMAEKTEEFWKVKLNRGKLMNPYKVPQAPEFSKKGEYGLYFGRLIDEKGVDVLLKALTVAKDIPFVIVGNGPEEDNLKKMAEEAGLKNVQFVGPKWGAELDEYLNNCKYVVCPSTWHENFPYVILQSFAAGKPVIGTLRGGIPEMITKDRGALYEAQDYETLAKLMQEYDKDTEGCVEKGKAARKYVEETFNDTEFYKAIVENYNKILKK